MFSVNDIVRFYDLDRHDYAVGFVAKKFRPEIGPGGMEWTRYYRVVQSAEDANNPKAGHFLHECELTLVN